MYDQESTPDQTERGSLLAAVDMGSNSFYMVVARLVDGQLKPIDVMSEKVQLAAGLDSSGLLSESVQQVGLECLSRFAQRLADLPRKSIRAVGTNALREAVNSDEFIERASQILGIPVQIIAGREEARLIHLGVSHTLAHDSGRRLVIDIGGGSTECVIGERFEPRLLESLQMGCVSFTKQFFHSGQITESAFLKAETAAQQELLSLRRDYRRLGWSNCAGSSGTIKAIKQACEALGYCEISLTTAAIRKLKEYLLKQAHVDKLSFENIKPERIAVLPAGLAILTATFNSLGIKEMEYSDGALREGVLYDMAGRLRHEDVRERTILALMRRYHVDAKHAAAVEATALIALAQIKDKWNLGDSEYHDMLCWSARSHEIGLTISHSRFHRHSAYLLQHSDLPGFSNLDQLLLAFLVRGHRRKIPKDELRALPKQKQDAYLKLCLILRLAIILHRSRSKARLPALNLRVEDQKLQLSFPPGWLAQHPLTQADLEQEIEFLRAIDYKLKLD